MNNDNNNKKQTNKKYKGLIIGLSIFGALAAAAAITAPIVVNFTKSGGDKPASQQITVKFVNGSQTTTLNLEKGSRTIEPVNPTQENKTFKFWTKDGTNAFDFNTILNEDTTLTAKFDDKSLSYIAITTQPTVEFNKGDTFNHDGIAVTGFYDNGDQENVTAGCEYSGYNMNTPGTQDVIVKHTDSELTSTYKIVVKDPGVTYHTVTFKVNSNVYVTQPVADGDKAFKPINPTSIGSDQVFKYWCKDGETTEFSFDSTITSDIVLNAKIETSYITSILITTPATKISFSDDNDFLSNWRTGMVIKGVQDNGILIDVTTSCTISVGGGWYMPGASQVTETITLTHTRASGIPTLSYCVYKTA